MPGPSVVAASEIGLVVDQCATVMCVASISVSALKGAFAVRRRSVPGQGAWLSTDSENRRCSVGTTEDDVLVFDEGNANHDESQESRGPCNLPQTARNNRPNTYSDDCPAAPAPVELGKGKGDSDTSRSATLKLDVCKLNVGVTVGRGTQCPLHHTRRHWTPIMFEF